MGFKFFKQRTSSHDKKNIHDVKWPGYVVTLTDKNFDDFIREYPLSLVDFWAPWCGPCKAMAPRLRRLSQVYKEKLAVGRLNTQEYEKIAKQYKIMSIPNLIFFSYGKKILNVTGARSVGDLKDTINRLLKKNSLKP